MAAAAGVPAFCKDLQRVVKVCRDFIVVCRAFVRICREFVKVCKDL